MNAVFAPDETWLHTQEVKAGFGPEALLQYNLSLHDVVASVQANNGNVGAQFIVKNAEQYVVRSVGLAERLEDLERIVLKSVDGRPVYLNQVADVQIGGEHDRQWLYR